MNEILKLPGKEDDFNQIITDNINNINIIIKNGSYNTEKSNILNFLERINFFVSNQKHVLLIIDKGFIFLYNLLNSSLSEEENIISEDLLNNEFALIKLVSDSVKETSSSIINVIKIFLF